MRETMTTRPTCGSGCKEIRILLVDDQPGVRRGLRLLLQLETGAIVVGEADSAREVLDLAVRLKPDLVIMDVEASGIDGITAMERLLALQPECAVIILTLHSCPKVRSRALIAGARRFVEKGRPQEIQDAFRQIFGT